MTCPGIDQTAVMMLLEYCLELCRATFTPTGLPHHYDVPYNNWHHIAPSVDGFTYHNSDNRIICQRWDY